MGERGTMHVCIYYTQQIILVPFQTCRVSDRRFLSVVQVNGKKYQTTHWYVKFASL